LTQREAAANVLDRVSGTTPVLSFGRESGRLAAPRGVVTGYRGFYIGRDRAALLHGEQTALDAVRSDPEFRRVLVRAGFVVDNIGLVSAYSGDALGRQMGLFGELAQELPQAT
jgi:hypothetical protein